MAFVAFDLDNTLGYFDTVAPLAFFMSPEFIQNPEEGPTNPLVISKRLRTKLAHIRKELAAELLKRPDLLDAVLRPNLDDLIKPILKHGATVIIYSNTGNTLSTHLAKDMIERKYRCPGLIQLIADVFHPLRKPETTGKRGADGFRNPQKHFPVLERLLQAASNRHEPIHPDQILFVDDKTPMHPIAEAIPRGLTYIKPTAYAPRVSERQRQGILEIALGLMDRAGLLSDEEYLGSAFCFRRIHRMEGVVTLRGFPDLFSYVWKTMHKTNHPLSTWKEDTPMIQSEMRRFFRQ